MDPITILTLTSRGIGVAQNLESLLRTVISQTRDVDRNVELLQQEIDGLKHVLQSMNATFGDSQTQNANLEKQTGAVGEHWARVRKLIKNSNATLGDLERVLSRVVISGGAWARPVRAFKLNWNSTEIAYFRDQIKIFTSNISLSLQMILVYVNPDLIEGQAVRC